MSVKQILLPLCLMICSYGKLSSHKSAWDVPTLLNDSILIYTPTVFSPNGDGVNDHFMIFAKPTGLKIKQLAIYSYWSQKVHSLENFEVTNDYFFGWDGVFKGAVASPGTYVWILSYEDLDGSIKIKRGTVALIR